MLVMTVPSSISTPPPTILDPFIGTSQMILKLYGNKVSAMKIMDKDETTFMDIAKEKTRAWSK